VIGRGTFNEALDDAFPLTTKRTLPVALVFILSGFPKHLWSLHVHVLYCTQQNRGILPRLSIQLKRVIHLRWQERSGKSNGKSRAFDSLAMHADRAAVILNEALDIRQS
jgi:hypothetical protein